jgi:hypothetical protein
MRAHARQAPILDSLADQCASVSTPTSTATGRASAVVYAVAVLSANQAASAGMSRRDTGDEFLSTMKTARLATVRDEVFD